MSEELCYSNLVFTTSENSLATVKKNEEILYAQVKKAEPAPETSHPVPDDSRTTAQETSPPAQAPEKPEHRHQPHKWAVVFLSLTCALLLAGIIALSVCYDLSKSDAGQLKKDNSALMKTSNALMETNSALMENNTALMETNSALMENNSALMETNSALMENNSVLMETNKQLQVLKSNVTVQNEFLESENKQLLKSQTLLDEILQFRNFPVENYCPNETTCSRCPTGWIFNNSKCYFLYLGQTWDTWRTWNDSRTECFKMGADLLTIQDEEEQMFIMKLATAYNDIWHGYWIGLTRPANNWVWVNGSAMTTGFWANEGSDNYVLINPSKTILNSWQTNNPTMFNRWICENKALLF
ncbi:CD209 antigen-like protein B isoform X2 [Brienomyrus brachyistius]|uniref:CD209 antigen-like protein B isoform X2 n=1 Tax=Brienomyrus brachyistius TaxID=42636 RepID=UPI0020B2E04A|nr:CD209 antigen-like protein B isoform X2 [Brienomyrus brachyistius]